METARPWLLGLVLWLVLLGVGRGLLWGLGWDRMRAASRLFLGLVVGMVGLHYALFGLSRLGPLGPRTAWLLLAVGLVLALPGLYRAGRDLRGGPLGWRGAGTPAVWTLALLMLVTLALSAVWLTGAFGFEGLEVWVAQGRTWVEPGAATSLRDDRLRDGLWEGWAWGLDAPAASLALFWLLALGLLLGAGALGRNLHSRGAGLAAATLLALVLFAAHHPLRLEPQLFGALALLGVMVLAVEGRRRPHVGFSLLAGLLAGYAWLAEPLAWTLLLPLALFGPSWCKSLDRRERIALDAGYDPGRDEDWKDLSLGVGYRFEAHEAWRGEVDDAPVDLRVDYTYEVEREAPLAAGAGGADDPGWGEDLDLDLGGGPKKKLGTPLRHGAVGLGGLAVGVAPGLSDDLSLRPLGLGLDRPPDRPELGLELGYDLDWPAVDFGPTWLDTGTVGAGVDPFWDFFLWGGLLGVLALGSLAVARHRTRSAWYLAPALLWLALAGTATGWDGPWLAGWPLLAGLGGLTLAEAWWCRELGCLPSAVGLGVPGAVAVGGLGLSGAWQCGSWDELEGWYEERREPLRYELRYDWAPTPGIGEPEPTQPGPDAPAPRGAPPDTPQPDAPQPDALGQPDAPAQPGEETPRQRPSIPDRRPDVRPDVRVDPGAHRQRPTQPSVPQQPRQPGRTY